MSGAPFPPVSGLWAALKAALRGAAGLLCLGTCLGLAACGDVSDQPELAVFEGPPRPALWKVQDADTTLYLFGTIHLLPPGMDWQTPALSQALTDAKAVYFEADTELAPGDLLAIVQRLGMGAPGQRLSASLTDAQQARLRAAAGDLNLSLTALDAMLPWYASVVISDAAIRKAGFDNSAGVESVLRPPAEAAGKEIRFLETVEDQLAAYTTLPQPVQVKLLDVSLADLETAASTLTHMAAAWRSGDDEALAGLVIDEPRAALPEIHQTLITKRNADWARTLMALLETEPGVFLVAVGAAHLLGEDSVLRQLPHPATRIQ